MSLNQRRTILHLEELERREMLDASAFPTTNNGGVYLLSDQLAGNITGAMTKFIATHFVGTEKLVSSYNDTFKAYNPNWVLLNYRLATESGPVDYIVGDQWGSDWSMVNSHEDWFMHNASGQRLTNSAQGWDLNDISNPAFDQYFTSSTINSMEKTGAVGLMADVFDAGIGGWWFNEYDSRFAGTNAANPAAWPNGVTWIDQLDNYIQTVQTAYAATPQKFLFIPNVGALDTQWDTTNYQSLDGAFLEGFAVGPGYLGDSTVDWQLGMNRALPMSAAGKVLIMQPYLKNDSNTTLGLEQRGYELGSYFLLQGAHTYLNVVGLGGKDPTGAWYYPEDTLQMGDPLTPVATNVSQYAWNGVYRRDFQNGIVLVNPTGKSVTINLGQTYQEVSFTGGGGLSSADLDANGNYIGGSLQYTPVSSVTLAPGTAAILMKTSVVIDNGQVGYSETGSGWTSYGAPWLYNGNSRNHAGNATTATATATWQDGGLAAGTYTIEADWHGSANHASNAVYQIYDGNGNLLASGTVNQRVNSTGGSTVNGVTFQKVATVNLTTSGPLKVVLSNKANGSIVADAVLILPS